MKRKIAAIMAADVVGYSRMIADDEEDTLRRLIAYREVFADFVTRGGGRIFNTAGDAVLAEFPSAVEGLRAAVEIQESIRTRNLAYPESRHMRFRIGMTIGDVVERDGDLLGDGVNVAARLEGLAEPGGICVARSVHEQVGNKLSVIFRDIGPQAVKNIPNPVYAFKISTAVPEMLPAVVAVPTPPSKRSRLVAAGLALALTFGGGAVWLIERPIPASAPPPVPAHRTVTAIVVAAPSSTLPTTQPGAAGERAAAPSQATEAARTPIDAAPASAAPLIATSGQEPSPASTANVSPLPAAPEASKPSAQVAVLPPARSATETTATPAPIPVAGDDAAITDPALLAEIADRLYEQNLDPAAPDSAATSSAIRSFETRTGAEPSGRPTLRLLDALRAAPPLKPWGSIAYAEGGTRWGMAWAMGSRREALAEARHRCGTDECKAAISFFGHRCGAFAISGRGWSITWREDAALARQGALDICGQHGPACHVVGTVCANGTELMSNLGSDQNRR